MAHACNASHLGGWGRRIAWTQDAVVAVSQDRATALQPEQQERNFVSKKRKEKFVIKDLSKVIIKGNFLNLIDVITQHRKYYMKWWKLKTLKIGNKNKNPIPTLCIALEILATAIIKKEKQNI